MPAPKPIVSRLIQPRDWNLQGTYTPDSSKSKGMGEPIYASDIFTVREQWANGVGNNLEYNVIGVENERVGIYIEKVTASNPNSASFSNAESYLDERVTGADLQQYYVDIKRKVGNSPIGSSTGTLAKANSAVTLTWSRDYALEFGKLPLDTYGTYRVVAYAGEPDISARDSQGKLEDTKAWEMDVFELRGLAITDFKVSPDKFEPEGPRQQVTISGNISVYPNQTTNQAPAWTPQYPVAWEIVIKHPLIPQNQWKTFQGQFATSGPGAFHAPDANGVIANISVTWDGELPNGGGLCFLQFEVEARATVQLPVSWVSNITHRAATPVARAGVLCKKCETKQVNFFAEEQMTISPYGEGGPSVPLNGSSSDHSNEESSMGYGWFSTENIKVYKLSSPPNPDLAYCDETGMCRRWVWDGSKYEPFFEDNRLSISVNSGNSAAYFTVKSRDNFQRIFDSLGNLRKEIDRNGRVMDYTKSASRLEISDEYGRKLYCHFGSGKNQPHTINDNILDTAGRRYLLEYHNAPGTARHEHLAKITDPVGDKICFEYDGVGRVSERREELQNHHRSVIYEYDNSNSGRLKSQLTKATLLNSNPALNEVTEFVKKTYTYNVPLSYVEDPYQIVNYIATQIVVEDKMIVNPGANDEVSTAAKKSTQFIAYDTLSRVLGEFEVVAEGALTPAQETVITDETHIATLHKYNDPQNPLSESSDPWLRIETLQVNKNAKTNWQYDARGNVKLIKDDQLNETLLTYMHQENASHPFPDLVIKVRKPAKDRLADPMASDYYYKPIELAYDLKGNLTSVKDAKENMAYFDYRLDGRIKRTVNRRGFKTYFEYDSRARISKVYIQKGELPSSLSFMTFASEPDPSDFRSLTFKYDDTSSISYDNLEKVVDDNGSSIEIEYDAIDRPKKLWDGEQALYTFDYQNRVLDEVGLPDSNTDVPELTPRTGRFANISHDSLGRVLDATRRDSVHTSELRVGFAYDGFSQLRSLIRLKNGQRRSHKAEYDRQGRTVKMTDAKNSSPGVVNPKSSITKYEPYCVEFATTSARGIRRKTNFDSLCRLRQITVGTPDPLNDFNVAVPSETRVMDYDDLGRLLSSQQVIPGSGSLYGQAVFGQSTYGASGSGVTSERTYHYDALDRIEKVVFEDSKEIVYEYDNESNVITVTENASGNSKVTAMTYFGDNRLRTVTYVRTSGNQVFTYAYDAGGRPKTLSYPASTGIVAHFSGPTGQVGWDGNGQLLHLRYMKGSDTIRRFEFSYDDAGNRTSQLDVVSIASPLRQTATRWVYGYDWLDRLETVRKATGSSPTTLGALQLVSMYTYDAADNRTEFQVPNLADSAQTETFKSYYDDADNITLLHKKIGSGSYATLETFTSDDDGNMLTRVKGGVTTTYTWSAFNRLAAIATTDNSKKQINTFGISGFRRKKKDKNDVETTEYAAGLATAVSKAQGGDTVTYLMGHRLMGFERSSDGAMFYFITDSLSSVRDLVNSSGSVVASYEFSEYGQRTSSANTGGVESQKTFVGGRSVQDEVADTGLMMMGHRFYEPSGPSGGIGRFLNRDPIGFAGGLNGFEYAAGQPIAIIDPSGLQPGGDLNDALYPDSWTGEETIPRVTKQLVNKIISRLIVKKNTLSSVVEVIVNYTSNDIYYAHPEERDNLGNSAQDGRIKISRELLIDYYGTHNSSVLESVIFHEILHKATQLGLCNFNQPSGGTSLKTYRKKLHAAHAWIYLQQARYSDFSASGGNLMGDAWESSDVASDLKKDLLKILAYDKKYNPDGKKDNDLTHLFGIAKLTPDRYNGLSDFLKNN